MSVGHEHTIKMQMSTIYAKLAMASESFRTGEITPMDFHKIVMVVRDDIRRLIDDCKDESQP